MAHRISLRIGVELGLFRILGRADGTPVSAKELAEQAGCNDADTGHHVPSDGGRDDDLVRALAEGLEVC